MAAAIKQKTGLDAQLVEGARGEFTVWVGEKVVARKDAHGFPSDSAAVTAVQEALARD
ncbi:MAG TPA: hypothetical protein VH701_10135 [Vicinamibacterales bacterium]